MITGFFTFLFLYGLVAIFERNRDDLSAFPIAATVMVPIIAVVLVRIGGYFAGLGLWNELLAVVTLIVATYLMLNKNLEISGGRAAGYTAAVFVFNVLIGVGFEYLSGAA